MSDDDYLGLSPEPARNLATIVADWDPKADDVQTLVTEAETLADEPINVSARLTQIAADGRSMAGAIETAVSEAEGFEITLDIEPAPILDGWMAAALAQQEREEVELAIEPYERAALVDEIARLEGELSDLYDKADAHQISDNDPRIDETAGALRRAQTALDDATALALTPAVAGRINELGALVERSDHPSGEGRRTELRAEIDSVFLDPTQADAIFKLVSEGAPIQIAYASVTGNWQDVPGGNPIDYTEDDKRQVISMLGIDLPGDLTPGDLVGIDEIIGALPDDIVAKLFAIGGGYEFTGVVGIATPTSSWTPFGASATRQLGGQVELSNQQIGVGFTQTHRVEISVTATAEVRFSVGKSTIGKAYKYLKGFEVVSGPMEALMRKSTLLRWGNKIPFSVAYTRFAGTELAYEATINADQAVALADGDASVLPDILDPNSIETGNSLLLRAGTLEGTTWEAKYKLAYIEDTHTEFSGLGFGVTKLDDNTVAIYSGPIEAVENQTFLGLKLIAQIGIQNTTELSHREFAYAELDLNTPEGVEAYNEFISGGGVPTTTTPGVLPARTSTIEVDSQTDFRFAVGSFGADFELGGWNSDYNVTEFENGDRFLTNTFSFGDAQAQFEAPVRSDGTVDFDASTFSLVVADVNRHVADALDIGFGAVPAAEVQFDESQHVQLVLSGTDVAELQELARDHVRTNSNSEAEYQNTLEVPWPTNAIEMIAAAETPVDVLIYLTQIAKTSPYGLLEDLQTLGLDSAFEGDIFGPGDLPGTVTFVTAD